jgi:hypothetical protein
MAPQMRGLTIDIAQRLFLPVGMEDTGVVMLRKRLARGELLAFIASLPPLRRAWTRVGAPTTGPGVFASMVMRCG